MFGKPNGLKQSVVHNDESSLLVHDISNNLAAQEDSDDNIELSVDVLEMDDESLNSSIVEN
jgi:hypothetical protein